MGIGNSKTSWNRGAAANTPIGPAPSTSGSTAPSKSIHNHLRRYRVMDEATGAGGQCSVPVRKDAATPREAF
ncbi:hypothetical protein SNOG_12662 [Parastagonospora nodorum SN15]|uniref:Uncharacterized protein n=1 Tax=Phaeosphaeria nodorum (strain SN15 / ATCC MYA-4574 / FGSC 10173) TaxID=321614 RepID=Q0U6F2_PHANO|nr:hypothetical protein SNOG_12662 [Parastagonospora nodorum SN15]EAT79960.1 hypothetical protein SNOG_12662 [Parastagonospora nodorum SN15]